MKIKKNNIEEIKLAVEPDNWRREKLVEAVVSAGASVSPIEEASGLIWADPSRPELLPNLLASNLEWVQLPFAGIEPFLPMLDNQRIWTCGKGVYSQPVAEHVLGSILALKRGFVTYARKQEWSGPIGETLFGAHVVILGAGGIADDLLPLLSAFDCVTTVVRRSQEKKTTATHTATLDDISEILPSADVVVLALALTPATSGIVNSSFLELMSKGAILVNVARGKHVITSDLVGALRSGEILGAVLDVTDPEPLPEGHVLWSLDNCLITPHIGNTPEMGIELLASRVEENVRRYISGDPLLGQIDLELGY
ncbi:MAG: D-isomer specific 2-hydroxyacid dehydrogenase family protein [Actinomycetota bacterium]|nr:D-isomer specific 2-hydroxyacid dehydrogenase family protein [Actinomycetota bacterium]